MRPFRQLSRLQQRHLADHKPWFTKEKTYGFLTQKEVSFIGAPLAAGQHQAGVEKGPQSLRDGGLPELARSLGWKFHDVGDLDVEGAMARFQGDLQIDNVRNAGQIGLANELVHKTVAAEAAKGNFALIVGGDHSIGSATVTGMKSVHEDLCVVWVDAHADCNTARTSPSGNYHGMSAAHAMGWLNIPGWEWMKPEVQVSDYRVAFIALRDVDQLEKELLRKSGVAVFTMHEVDKWGIGPVFEMALHRVNPHSDRPIHLSFDIDSCDPSISPGTGTCSRGGLNFREAHYICEALSMTNALVSMDLVEINPLLDEPVSGRMHGDNPLITATGMTSRLGIELVGSALGRTIL